MSGLLVLLLQTGGLPVDPEIAAAAIRAWQECHGRAPLARVEVSPVPGRPDLVGAICDYQDSRWGFFSVYCLAGGAVHWEATAGSLEEESVHKARALRVPGFPGPMVEVFSMTHRGNGFLYLCELRGRSFVTLLKTRAVDAHVDGQTFREWCLEPDYVDFNGDGSIDVVLRGEIDEWDEKGDVVLRSRPCRKVCLWDAVRGRFVEEPSLEEGLSGSTGRSRFPLILASSALLLASCFLLLLSPP